MPINYVGDLITEAACYLDFEKLLNKYVVALAWHPTIFGLFAISYSHDCLNILAQGKVLPVKIFPRNNSKTGEESSVFPPHTIFFLFTNLYVKNVSFLQKVHFFEKNFLFSANRNSSSSLVKRFFPRTISLVKRFFPNFFTQTEKSPKTNCTQNPFSARITHCCGRSATRCTRSWC